MYELAYPGQWEGTCLACGQPLYRGRGHEDDCPFAGDAQ